MFRSLAGDPPERCAKNRSTRAHASALVVAGDDDDDERQRERERGERQNDLVARGVCRATRQSQ